MKDFGERARTRDLIAAAFEWGFHEAGHCYGRRNTRKARFRDVIRQYAHATNQTIKAAEKELRDNGFNPGEDWL